MSKFFKILNEVAERLLTPSGFEPIVPMLRRDALGQDIQVDKSIDSDEMGEDYLPYEPQNEIHPKREDSLLDVQISEPYDRMLNDTEFKIDLMYRNGLIEKYSFHDQPEFRADNLNRIIKNYDKKKTFPPRRFDGQRFTNYKSFHAYLIKYIKFHSYKHT